MLIGTWEKISPSKASQKVTMAHWIVTDYPKGDHFSMPATVAILNEGPVLPELDFLKAGNWLNFFRNSSAGQGKHVFGKFVT